jgi:DNA-binding GntR family transcriptional regulator
MVVLVFVGHAEVERHLVQEVGLGQLHTPGLEVARHIEHQAVSALAQARMVVEHAVGVATIVVEGELLDQRGLLALRGVEGHLHAGSGAAVHRVQNVCAQTHENLLKTVRSTKVYTLLVFLAIMRAMDSNKAADTSATHDIVQALTRAIVEHRLLPGAKLAEQKLADHFGVSRTLVRQALFQLSQNRLIRMEPARGAFVAAPSVEEAQQVFAVRRMLETEMTRAFVQSITPAKIQALQEHIAQERDAVAQEDVTGRTELLGDFHVRMAQLMDNQVLAQMLGDLISRCALITLMYQSRSEAQHSADEHAAIVAALAKKDTDKAVRLMQEHLDHVEASLIYDRKVPSHDIAVALT